MTTATTPCGGTTTAQPAPSHACSCTDLECFDKPRFFGGQLLTDVDLEASMSYVAAKNRLHNRYLFGAGVVCGLSVRCDPCDSGSVVVESGYALDCNGDDVIVCSDQPFNVREYLDRRRKEKQADCSRSRVYVPDDCGPDETEYCLVVSYDERPGKPVNALVRDNGCRADRCEPSRTLERFRFDLVDKKTIDKIHPRPTFWSRIGECWALETKKVAAYKKEIPATVSMQELQRVVTRLRADVLAFAQSSGLQHCDLIDQICRIDKQVVADVQSQPANPNAVPPITGILRFDEHPAVPPNRTGANQLVALYERLLTDCACNALLMPCGECCEPDFVVLACLNIKGGHVISICNSVRTQVITGPRVRYFMQPLFDLTRRWVESQCCPDTLDRARGIDPAGAYAAGSGAAAWAQTFTSSLVERFTAPAASGSTVHLFQQPLADVQRELAARNITATVTQAATAEEAYRLGNLRDFAFEIQPGAHVELVVAPDGNVAAIRSVARTTP